MSNQRYRNMNIHNSTPQTISHRSSYVTNVKHTSVQTKIIKYLHLKATQIT
jgi:hypothetical protein